MDEQTEQAPRYMTIKEFCKYTGLSRWQFQRIADRYRIRLTPSGVSKLVDVETTMALLSNLPKGGAADQRVPEMWPGVTVGAE
jgi:hypothetical protein